MALSAFIICKDIDKLDKTNARRTFLDTLTKSLVLSEIENRMNNVHIVKQFNTRTACESFFGKPLNIQTRIYSMQSGPNTLEKKRDCKLCYNGPEKTRRKTRFFCVTQRSSMPTTLKGGLQLLFLS